MIIVKPGQRIAQRLRFLIDCLLPIDEGITPLQYGVTIKESFAVYNIYVIINYGMDC